MIGKTPYTINDLTERAESFEGWNRGVGTWTFDDPWQKCIGRGDALHNDLLDAAIHAEPGSYEEGLLDDYTARVKVVVSEAVKDLVELYNAQGMDNENLDDLVTFREAIRNWKSNAVPTLEEECALGSILPLEHELARKALTCAQREHPQHDQMLEMINDLAPMMKVGGWSKQRYEKAMDSVREELTNLGHPPGTVERRVKETAQDEVRLFVGQALKPLLKDIKWESRISDVINLPKNIDNWRPTHWSAEDVIEVFKLNPDMHIVDFSKALDVDTSWEQDIRTICLHDHAGNSELYHSLTEDDYEKMWDGYNEEWEKTHPPHETSKNWTPEHGLNSPKRGGRKSTKFINPRGQLVEVELPEGLRYAEPRFWSVEQHVATLQANPHVHIEDYAVAVAPIGHIRSVADDLLLKWFGEERGGEAEQNLNDLWKKYNDTFKEQAKTRTTSPTKTKKYTRER